MNWYLDTLYKIIAQPTLFFENMPKGSWQEDSLSFSLVTGWILSFALALVIFINNYLPTGFSLIEGIYGRKLFIAIPVLSIMGFAFFAMTLLIIGGIVILVILGLFFLNAAVFDFLLILLGGSGNIFEVAKASLYLSAVTLAGLVNILLMMPVKYKVLSTSFWILSEKIIFYATCVFLYYLLGVLGEKVHKVPRWKAFLAATVPFVVLVLVNIVFSAKVLPKLVGFLG